MNNDRNLRVIKTARNERDINAAVAKGFRPLIKLVIPSPEIKSKFAILQDKRTGKIEVINDFRAPSYNKPKTLDIAIDFTFYYPYQFENPYAAYLIPGNIKESEHVWIEDLIEDIICSSWNQGDKYRLRSSEGTWAAGDLKINFDLTGVSFDIVG